MCVGGGWNKWPKRKAFGSPPYRVAGKSHMLDDPQLIAWMGTSRFQAREKCQNARREKFNTFARPTSRRKLRRGDHDLLGQTETHKNAIRQQKASPVRSSGWMSTLLKEIINWYASQFVATGCDWDMELGDGCTSETPRAKFQAHTSLNEQETEVWREGGRAGSNSSPSLSGSPGFQPLQLLTKSIKVLIKTKDPSERGLYE